MLASSAYAALLAEAGRGAGHVDLVRVIVGGGHATSTGALVRRHYDRLADVALFNEYGPTEAAVFSTAARVEAGDDTPPIGVPIPGTRIYLLDEQLALCCPGEIGASLHRWRWVLLADIGIAPA